jgi:hypothetical protein
MLSANRVDSESLQYLRLPFVAGNPEQGSWKERQSMHFVPFTQQPLFSVSVNTSFQFFIQAISFAPG